MVSMQLGKEDERKINKLERARKSWLDANTPPMIVSYFALFHTLVKIHTYQMQWKLIWPQKGTDEKIIIEPKKIIQVWVINWYLTRWPSKCKGFVHSLKDLNNHGYNIWIRGFWRSWISTMSVWQRRQWKTWAIKLWVWGQLQEVRLLKNHVESAHACVLEVGKRVQRGQLGHCTWSQGQCSWSEPLNWYLGLLYNSVVFWVTTSGDTLCRDNCQLIGMPFFYTRLAGKNNRN